MHNTGTTSTYAYHVGDVDALHLLLAGGDVAELLAVVRLQDGWRRNGGEDVEEAVRHGQDRLVRQRPIVVELHPMVLVVHQEFVVSVWAGLEVDEVHLWCNREHMHRCA